MLRRKLRRSDISTEPGVSGAMSMYGDRRRRKTVLIVDDDRLIRRALCRALEAAYEPVQAEDVSHAIRVCESRPIDLVVTDVLMPVMTGFELVAHLRCKMPHLRVVFISATEAAPAGLDLFLVKPFSQRTFLEIVRLALAAPDASTNS
jgi:CheY-like chemotaxis protein